MFSICFQYLPRWTTLQAVVFLGPNPLPAEVCVKKSPEHGLEFLYMDQKEWFTEAMQEKVYMDPVQAGVRIVIGRALVEMFDLFEYELNKDTDRYILQLPLCQASLIHEVIGYVTKQAANVMYKWS